LDGLFGADGHSPALRRPGPSPETSSLSRIAYSQSSKPEFVEATKAMMEQVVNLLVRCGVKARGASIRNYPVRHAATSYPQARDGIPRREIRLELPEGLSFVERVGFRYCVDKTMRASAAAVYWRTVDTINRQRLWMADRLEELHRERFELSFSETRALAAAELTELETPVFRHYSLLEGHDRFSRLPSATARQFQPFHGKSCAFPAPPELFAQLGVRGWFAPLNSRDTAPQPKRYCVEKESLSLPGFSLTVVDRRPAGTRAVFDLAVNDLHAFVAGTACVHNCIGNSGPLKPEISAAVKAGDLTACSVLSGNRNFEGRVHPEVRMNFLASPPLVVAYALAGPLDIDLATEPLGTGSDGKPVYLKDLWPSDAEVQELMVRSIDSQMFRSSYANVFKGDENW